MTLPNRKDVRYALASLLDAGCEAAHAVYAYPKLDLDGESPVITLSSGGSEREPVTMQGCVTTVFLDLHILVLQRGTDWTEAQAEDALDTVEQQVYSVLLANRSTPAWMSIDYDGRTDARRPLAMPGGVVYLHEVIQLRIQGM